MSGSRFVGAGARVAVIGFVAAAGVGLAACAGGPGPVTPMPRPETFSAVPGFDTRDYPGAAAMRAWHDASPYRWVGYYLTAPCYTGTTWQGRRQEIQAMGWGIGVLFVGEQDWGAVLVPGGGAAAVEAAGADSVPADTIASATTAEEERVARAAEAGTAARCTRGNLSEAGGRADGAAAAGAAAGEGFAAGSVVFLDVERVDSVSAELAGYVRGWFEGMLEDGRYSPGLYAHARNAEDLATIGRSAYRAAGSPGEPRLWVATSNGFDVHGKPSDSGFDADVWQGALDVSETWGGVTLRVDVDVAESADPSTPGS